jgi:hypothetical protein
MKGKETNETGGEGKVGRGGEGRGSKGKEGGEEAEEKGRDWPAHLFEPSAAYVLNGFIKSRAVLSRLCRLFTVA